MCVGIEWWREKEEKNGYGCVYVPFVYLINVYSKVQTVYNGSISIINKIHVTYVQFDLKKLPQINSY